MGGIMAPVPGSGSIPAWMSRVANFMRSCFCWLPADGQQGFLIVPGHKQLCFILITACKTNGHNIDVCLFFNRNIHPENILLTIIVKCCLLYTSPSPRD